MRRLNLEQLDQRLLPSMTMVGDTLVINESTVSQTILRPVGTDGISAVDYNGSTVTVQTFAGVHHIVYHGSDQNNSYVNSSRISDEVFLGGGNDRAISYADGAQLHGGGGNDALFAYGSNAVLDGGDGDDRLVAQQASSVMIGGGGQDTFYGPGLVLDQSPTERHYV